MSKDALVEKYRSSLVQQGYPKDDIEETIREFSRVMDERPQAVNPLLLLLSNPVPKSWWNDEPAGRRLDPDTPLAISIRKRAKSHKKKYLAPVKKAPGNNKSKVYRRKPKATVSQHLFNNR